MRFAWGVVGALWVLCGAAVGISPPVLHSDGTSWSPLWGWVVVAGGVFLVVLAVRGDAVTGRHANGRTAPSERRVEVRLLFSAAFGLLAGAVLIWVGIDTDQVALTSYGIVVLGLVVFAVPHVVDAVHRLGRG